MCFILLMDKIIKKITYNIKKIYKKKMLKHTEEKKENQNFQNS